MTFSTEMKNTSVRRQPETCRSPVAWGRVAAFGLLSAGLLLGIAACGMNDAPLAASANAEQTRPVRVGAGSPAEPQTRDKAGRPEAAKPAAEAVPKNDKAEDLVALAEDDATKLLRERLSPPKQVVVEPPAPTAEPQPRPLGAVETLSAPLVKLPEAAVPPAPLVLPGETFKGPFAHPALDAPPLAFALDPRRPKIPRLPIGPGAHVVTPDYKPIPYLARFPRDPEPLVTFSDDPSQEATQGVITALLALPVPVLPPPLLLSIPDPYEHARAVELRPAPPDADRPAISHVPPPRQVLTPPEPQP